MSIGKMVTSITGIVSRKGCMRLATETGTRMVDRSRELGRNLNKSDVEQVFAETLPKSCRPKILTTREEIASCLVKSGVSPEEAYKMSQSGQFLACCVTNGSKKRPIYIPFEHSAEANDVIESVVTHELEHALECNNRLSSMIIRKIKGIKKSFGGLLGRKKISEEDLYIEKKTHEYESHVINSKIFGGSVNFARVLKNFVDIQAKGSRNNKTLKAIQSKMDTEIPAYTVGGKVDEYKRKILAQNMEPSSQTRVADAFKSAKQNVKQSRIKYWMNKLFGRLGRPTVYQSDKDLMRLVSTKEEKQVLKSFVKDMNMEEKGDIFNVLKNPAFKVDDVINLSKELSKDGKMIYSWRTLSRVNSEILLDKEFVKYLKMVGEDGKPVLSASTLESLKYLTQEGFANFKKILNSVDKKEVPIYAKLVSVLDSPNLDVLKKFFDVQKGKDSISETMTLIRKMDRYLSQEEIVEVTEKFKNTGDFNEVRKNIEKLIRNKEHAKIPTAKDFSKLAERAKDLKITLFS